MTDLAVAPAGTSRRWAVLVVLTLVAFVTNLDATIVIIALPKLMAGLHTSVTVGLWTLTAYIITSTILLLPAGRWSDIVGGKRVFLLGLAIFTVATVLCGLSGSGTELIVARLVQGAGGALALATATPLIVATFPADQLGMALGINSTAWVMGLIVGPIAGGALVGTVGWRSVFFVAVPFALVGCAVGAVVIPAGHRRAGSVRIDWVGTLSFAAALVLLLLGLSEGQSWGWRSLPTVGVFVLAVGLFAVFTWWELHDREPIFDLRLLARRHFRWGLAVDGCYSIGFFATTFLLTFYLQGALHLSALDAGLMLIPLSVPQLLLAPLGGLLADRFGPARLVSAGAVLLMVSAVLLGHEGPRLDLAGVVVPLVVMSVANSILWPAMLKAVMSSVPSERSGVGSGLFYTVRNVGMSLSLTLALVAAEASLPKAVASRVFLGTAGLLSQRSSRALVHSTDAGFLLFFVFYALALVASFGLHRRWRRARVATTVQVPGRELDVPEGAGAAPDAGALPERAGAVTDGGERPAGATG
ncbi:MAG: MFS transporter [Acidimicrobiales bacterium]